MMDACCCCLEGTPDKDLTTPYTHLGKTEIYSHMLKQCFDLQMTLGDGECGICSPCVRRLRDASDFKLQVCRSQAELRVRLQGASHVKEEQADKSEMVDEDGTSDEHVLFEPEISLKEEPSGWDGGNGDAGNETCGREVKYEFEPGPEPAQDFEAPTESNHTAIVELEPVRVPEFTPVQDQLSNMQSTSSHAQATQERYISDITPYECGMCGEKYKELVELTLHVSTVHRKKPAPKKSVPNIVVPKLDVPTPEKKPKKTQHDVTESKSETQKKKGCKIYACNSCDKIFASKGGLSLHKRTHGKKLFSCKICKKEFNFLCNLQSHERTHTGEKPYTCEVCNREFRHLSHMVIHKRIHSGEKPYPCKVCNTMFRSSTDLRAHSRVHTVERSHKCESCEKRFATLRALKWHKRVHASE